MSTADTREERATVNWAGRRVLVTGAGGFIGSHLAERLARSGATVRALVHYNALASRSWLDDSPVAGDMEIVAGDICDAECVRRMTAGVDVVFHLAALIGIPYSYIAPASYVRTNIEGTLNVLQAARDNQVSRIVQTSTSEVYGTALYAPIDEKHPLQGQSPYSATKIGADKLAESFYQSFGVPVVTVRPFNTFGPRQSARAVIPTIITQCLEGGVVRLGALRPTRDLNYVANTVDGFLKASTSDQALGKAVNLGSGTEISIGDLAHLIARLMGVTIVVEAAEERQRPENSEVERLIADSALAKRLFDWSPTVGLEDGLRLTIEWFRANRGRYRSNAYAV
jgi:NAD dependent epimerase/dehydratase